MDPDTCHIIFSTRLFYYI